MEFTFNPLKEENLKQLYDWLGLPHVAAWWRESRDWQALSDKYRKWIGVDDVGPFFILHEEKPIGFILWYLEPNTERVYGFDIFIADVAYIGKGYGSEIIKQFIKNEIMQYNPIKIITDPEVTNITAIRAYEKVGFKKTIIRTGTDGTQPVPVQLMELDPDEL